MPPSLTGVAMMPDRQAADLRRVRCRSAVLRSAAVTAVVTSLDPPIRAAVAETKEPQIVSGGTDASYAPLRSDLEEQKKVLELRQVNTWLYGPLLQVVTAVYLGLSLFERPAWCYCDSACAAPDGQSVPMSGVPLLPTVASGCIDLACYAAFLTELAGPWCYKSISGFEVDSWRYARLGIMLVGAIDCVFDILAAHDFMSFTLSRRWRLTPILRPVVSTINNALLRNRMQLTAQVLWDVKAMLLLVTLLVMWFGVVMFAVFKKFCQAPECDESAYYGTVPQAMLSTFTILTTANFPDVYMEAYGYHRVFVLPFVAFASFGIFLSLNLIFASVYSSHKHRMESRADHDATVQEDSLGRAFSLLLADIQSTQYRGNAMGVGPATTWTRTDSGSLPIAVVKQFLRDLHWQGRRIDEDAVDRAVKMINADGDERIDCEEFRQLCRFLPVAIEDKAEVALSRFEQVAPSTKSSTNAAGSDAFANGDCDVQARSETSGTPTIGSLKQTVTQVSSARRQLRRTMRERDKHIERFMMVIIVANTVTIMYEVMYFNQVDHGWQKTVISCIELVFMVVYVLEMIVKISTWGWHTYWSKFRNKFDGVITTITVVSEVALHLPSGVVHQTIIGHGHGVTRFCTLLRGLRVLRVLTGIREFSLIFQSISELTPVFKRLGSVVVIIMVFFGQLGILMFGGQTYEGNPLLTNSTFDALRYYPNNFNDLGSALVVLFDFLVVNNWMVTVEGMSLVSGSPSSAYSFFIGYYVIVVMVVVNLLIAYVVDRYHEQHSLDRMLEQLLGAATGDETIMHSARCCFRLIATKYSEQLPEQPSLGLEESPEDQKHQHQDHDCDDETQGLASALGAPIQLLPVTHVAEVLEELNCNHSHCIQLNNLAIADFQSRVARTTNNHDLLCFEEFMELMVETLKSQYQMEQTNIARANRTL